MFGFDELKEHLEVDTYTVECPVKGCAEKVPRQRNVFKNEKKFMCPVHEIYISPSTFEYKDYPSNLLWASITDIALLESIMKVKRECRMSRDNSEDSLTWNIFRFLEKEELISDYVKNTLTTSITSPRLIYWSYSQMTNGLFNFLKQARSEFELVPSKGSEPDLIIIGEDNLIIIEAKVAANNETSPSNHKVEEKYVSGGACWWKEVFASDFNEVAINAKKYELSRFWLLGTWMAQKLGVDFHLVNLVPEKREGYIEQSFGKHIKQTGQRHFHRTTWEEIFNFISKIDCCNHLDKDLVLQYLHNKTIGYDATGKLKKTFSI